MEDDRGCRRDVETVERRLHRDPHAFHPPHQLCRQPFTNVQPCKQSVTGTVYFNTAALKDGNHTLKILVSDAIHDATSAGYQTAYNTSRNAGRLTRAVAAYVSNGLKYAAIWRS